MQNIHTLEVSASQFLHIKNPLTGNTIVIRGGVMELGSTLVEKIKESIKTGSLSATIEEMWAMHDLYQKELEILENKSYQKK